LKDRGGKVMVEWRWEYVEIGQGHYYTSLHQCLDEAYRASKDRPELLVRVEMFRPRRQALVFYQSGEESNAVNFYNGG